MSSSPDNNPSSLRPFHLAIPVHDLALAKKFYGPGPDTVLGLPEGRSSDKWQDYNLFGNQLVVHWVGEEYRGKDWFNPVDGDEVGGIGLRRSEGFSVSSPSKNSSGRNGFSLKLSARRFPVFLLLNLFSLPLEGGDSLVWGYYYEVYVGYKF